jgi:putative hemolysin
MLNADFTSLLPRMLPAAWPAPLGRLAARALGLDEMARTYEALRAMGGEQPIVSRLLTHLEVTTRVARADLERVPLQGAVIVVANHPYGLLESAVLARTLLELRPDVRVLANEMVELIPELRELVIAVDAMGTCDAARGNSRGLRRALEHLRRGGLLVVFPAGAVSHFDWAQRGITDEPWNPSVARMVGVLARGGVAARVVPVFVCGANSLLFQAAGMVHARLRTALLARELLNKRRRCVELRIGAAIDSERLLAMPTAEAQTDYLRWRTYLLRNRAGFKPETARPLRRRLGSVRRQAEIAAAESPAALAAEVGALPPEALLARSGELVVYLAKCERAPAVMREIGRLREIAFRAAGEGTGLARDIDRFDGHYLHLFVWHSARQEVVGAYRLAGTDAVVGEYGLRGLYTATLFQFDERFLARVGPALELGRSFIRVEYQRAFAPLLLLWKGIGKYIARHPRYRVLFGPVSISNRYQSISRELMVSFLEQRESLSGWMDLVRGRNAPRRGTVVDRCRDIEDLSEVVSDLEPDQAGIPVLLRQYLRLGGKLLGFNVDPEFSDALDGLILVDVTRTESRLLARYLGSEEAAVILDYQKGQHASH